MKYLDRWRRTPSPLFRKTDKTLQPSVHARRTNACCVVGTHRYIRRHHLQRMCLALRGTTTGAQTDARCGAVRCDASEPEVSRGMEKKWFFCRSRDVVHPRYTLRNACGTHLLRDQPREPTLSMHEQNTPSINPSKTEEYNRRNTMTAPSYIRIYQDGKLSSAT